MSRGRLVSAKTVLFWARAHVMRYPCTEARLARVLNRRLDKRAKDGLVDPEADTATWVPDAVAQMCREGLIDDAAYARGTAASLARKGQSRRLVAQKLRERGVQRPDIEAALAALTVADVQGMSGWHVEDTSGLDAGSSSAADVDFAAATRYVERRRLGKLWASADPKAKNRALAALARRGFGYGLARKALDATLSED